MEGYLSKYTNVVSGWKKRYFVIDNGVLAYSKQKKKEAKKSYNLANAEVVPDKKNPRQFLVDIKGIKLKLRGYTIEEAEGWIHAISQLSSAINISHMSPQEINADFLEMSQHRTTIFGIDDFKSPAINSRLEKLGTLHYAMVDEFKKFRTDLESQNKTELLFALVEEFRNISTDVFAILEHQNQKHNLHNEVLAEIGAELNLDLTNLYDTKLQEKLNQNKEPDMYEEIKSSDKEDEMFHDAREFSVMDASEIQNTKIAYRSCLPFLRNPGTKINIWKIVKDSIGNDLSKISVPVYLNEPLSFLQRFSEDLAYNEILLEAVNHTDSCLRLAYAGCYAVSSYCNSLYRTMKPFNPLLGETFELERDGFQLISEQVSHHPPVSALHCDHPEYMFWGSTEVKSNFRGTYLQIHPKGPNHLVFKRYGDHFTWEKPFSNAHNIIVGKVYTDHHGTIKIKNLTTGDNAKVLMKKRGWFDKQMHDVEAKIFDAEGNLRYNITGKWSDVLVIHDTQTGQEYEGLKMKPWPANYEHNYFFAEYTLQLNLPADLVPKLCPTDSRLRPDQRALENGDTKLASEEKDRLERKQRFARKKREEKKEEHEPRWFQYHESEWVYRGGYWEQKELGDFINTPEIF